MIENMRQAMTIEERFWRHVEKTDGCWLWTAALNKTGGYGVLWGGSERNVMLFAHRVSYEIHVGPIPDGMTLDHLCRVRSCVNPTHLEPCTTEENSHRGKERRETCRRGHPKAGNTYTPPGGAPDRCRICNGIKAREYRARLAAVPR